MRGIGMRWYAGSVSDDVLSVRGMRRGAHNTPQSRELIAEFLDTASLPIRSAA